MRVTWQAGGQQHVGTTGNSRNSVSTATFQVGPGEYDIDVEAAGYNKGTEHTSISRDGMRQTVYVYLTPVGSSTVATAAEWCGFDSKTSSGNWTRVSLRYGKTNMVKRESISRKPRRWRLPARTSVYLMGMLEYTAKDMPAARKQFESVLATYPAHERSLLMLGQMQLEAKENKDASSTLRKPWKRIPATGERIICWPLPSYELGSCQKRRSKLPCWRLEPG